MEKAQQIGMSLLRLIWYDPPFSISIVKDSNLLEVLILMNISLSSPALCEKILRHSSSFHGNIFLNEWMFCTKVVDDGSFT